MPRRRSHDSLMPPGLSIDHVEIGGTAIVAVARSRAARHRGEFTAGIGAVLLICLHTAAAFGSSWRPGVSDVEA